MSSIRRTPFLVAACLVAAALVPAETPEQTLRPDAFDAPAPTSVREAERAAAAAASGHVMSHRDLPPRGRRARGGSAARDAPASVDPHAGHLMPSPSPEPRR